MMQVNRLFTYLRSSAFSLRYRGLSDCLLHLLFANIEKNFPK